MTNQIESPRQNIASDSPWEPVIGFSRAVRFHNTIHVAGTIANDHTGNIHHPNDPHAQATFIINKIESALTQAGATLNDVVATRTYVTNIDHQQEVGKAHKESFGDCMPASTLVAVSALAHPQALVEIEATAMLPNQDTPA